MSMNGKEIKEMHLTGLVCYGAGGRGGDHDGREEMGMPAVTV